MIDYITTKQDLDARGIDFDIKHYVFALLCAFGIDHTEAYQLAVKDKRSMKDEYVGNKQGEYYAKCKKECDVLMSHQSIQQLTDYLINRVNIYIADKVANEEEVIVSPKMMKNLMAKILVRASDNIDKTAYSDIIKVVDSYSKHFAPEMDANEANFQRTFIQVMKPFNGCCNKCNREIDVPFGVNFTCPHCYANYVWDENKGRYLVGSIE